jgi:predicted enzyme related to lactoylglutathione lyase
MYAHAIELGALGLREPADQFHGNRSATVQDPFGQRWTLSARIEQLTTEQYAARAAQDSGHGSFSLETGVAAATTNGNAAHPQAKHLEQGDLYYFTLPVADVPRAQRFFGAVLGWQFGAPDQGHIENISAPPGGLNDKSTDMGARLWFVVDDIHTAVERVRAAGGTAQDPVNYESGWSSDCIDDQGTVFSLSVPSPEYSV